MNQVVVRAAMKRAKHGKGRRHEQSNNSQSLRTTILTVLLTFFLTTVGGGLLNFWTRLNENATQSAEFELEKSLDAYDAYVEEVEPKLDLVQRLGVEALDYGQEHRGQNIRAFVISKTEKMPSTDDFIDDGRLNLYLGQEASVGLFALSSQYLALRVMLERHAHEGEFPVSSGDAASYLTSLRLGYSNYLLSIIKCKRRVAKSFMFFGKMDEMQKCERAKPSVYRKLDIGFWGPRVFSSQSSDPL